jgi:hypothetical protein
VIVPSLLQAADPAARAKAAPHQTERSTCRRPELDGFVEFLILNLPNPKNAGDPAGGALQGLPELQ